MAASLSDAPLDGGSEDLPQGGRLLAEASYWLAPARQESCTREKARRTQARNLARAATRDSPLPGSNRGALQFHRMSSCSHRERPCIGYASS